MARHDWRARAVTCTHARTPHPLGQPDSGRGEAGRHGQGRGLPGHRVLRDGGLGGGGVDFLYSLWPILLLLSALVWARASVLVAACEASPGRGAGPQPGERHHTSKGARDGPLAQRRGANAIFLTLFPNLIANATRNKVGCWIDGTRG